MKLKNGMVIKCNSEKEAKEFIKEAHKQGFKWKSYKESRSNDVITYWDYASVRSKIYYILDADKITWTSIYSDDDSIEYSTLKENKTMTKSDLENGMVVELRNGKRFLIVNDLGIGEVSCINLNGYWGYDENLNDVNGDRISDITKIYKTEGFAFNNLFNSGELSLIWEREEKEMKVGDEVKVIDNGYCFDEYYDWVEEHINNRLLKLKFDYGNILPNGTICEVLHIDKHNHGCNSDDTVAYIQDIENKRCYLISIEGLEKID